jgi:hypothetical protein
LAERILADGYPFARIIGRIEAGPPTVRVA